MPISSDMILFGIILQSIRWSSNIFFRLASLLYWEVRAFHSYAACRTSLNIDSSPRASAALSGYLGFLSLISQNSHLLFVTLGTVIPFFVRYIVHSASNTISWITLSLSQFLSCHPGIAWHRSMPHALLPGNGFYRHYSFSLARSSLALALGPLRCNSKAPA